MAATQNGSTRSIRRRTSNRQAAFSFLSSIQLDPSTSASTITGTGPDTPGLKDAPLLEEHDEESKGAKGSTEQPQNIHIAPSFDSCSTPDQTVPMSASPEPDTDNNNNNAPLESPTEPRPNFEHKRTLSKKDVVATTFLSGISLKGDTATTTTTTPTATTPTVQSRNEQQLYSVLQEDMPSNTGRINPYFTHEEDSGGGGRGGGSGVAFDYPNTPQAQSSLFVRTPVQRSSSTPSLSGWDHGSGDLQADSSERDSIPFGRHRKTSHPSGGAYSSRHQQRLHLTSSSSSITSPSKQQQQQQHQQQQHQRHKSLKKGSSSGLLSTLLARDKERDSHANMSSSYDGGSVVSLRYPFHKNPTRWLAPLTDHVHIKPLISSGKARI
ncbi:hypothetical protein BG004_004743, partial [Podila humilis]